MQRPPDGRLVRRGVPAGVGARPRPQPGELLGGQLAGELPDLGPGACAGPHRGHRDGQQRHKRVPHPSPVARVGQFPKPVQQPPSCVGRCLFDPPVHPRLLPADSHGWVYQAPLITTNQHNRPTTLTGSFTSPPEPWDPPHPPISATSRTSKAAKVLLNGGMVGAGGVEPPSSSVSGGAASSRLLVQHHPAACCHSSKAGSHREL